MLKLFQIATGRFFCLLGKVMFDYRVYGTKNLQGLENGPVIFASNHCSLIDGPLGGMALPIKFLPIRFLVTEEYFTLKSNRMPRGLKWVSPIYTHLNGSLRVYRNKDPRVSLRNPLSALKHQNAKIWVFPEGTRGKDGYIKKGEGGIAFLHKYSRAPVVPCFISGNWNGIKPFQNKISVTFGQPQWNLYGLKRPKYIVEGVMQKIRDLSS